MPQLWSTGTSLRAAPERANDSKAFNRGQIEVPVQRRPVKDGNVRLGQERRISRGFENIVGCSERMLQVYRTVARAAPTKSTVLIQGETGTGKELIAPAVHLSSPRADSPFVAIDCSALAETLLESELFGHVKGAFTGALTDKRGLFEVAQGGTCFLDEVGEISPCMQAKLLRVLQEHEIKRVGGTESVTVDVRVIAATNRDLTKLVADGKFREDLFYRLSVVTVALPPLRDRPEDIPLLAIHFLRKYATLNGKPVSGISPAAMAVLLAHDWPGNVRQLEHAIECAVTLTSNPALLPEDLPSLCPPAQGVPAGRPPLTLRDVVVRHVQSVLKAAKWNKKLAAQLLGIHRRTLYRLTKRYGIPLGRAD